MIDGVKAMIDAERAEPDALPMSIYYFPLFGRGEASRMMLHHAGVEFLNKEIAQEDWP